MKTRVRIAVVLSLLALIVISAAALSQNSGDSSARNSTKASPFDGVIDQNAQRLLADGRKVFRFDTFGGEDFWGGQLRLHLAIEGGRFGGVGPGLSPKAALDNGLKVDADALPADFCGKLQQGQVNLNDPANTLFLLKQNAVVGVTGFFKPDGTLRSVGFQCALCHSTVDNSCVFGVGRRLDGWANRDLNVGAIVAQAPNLRPVADLLGTNEATVRRVLLAWGPGKFDAELLLDGKGFRPDGQSAATLIPNAFGLAGYNQHTWTGAWGTVTYWNAFVANIELHGKGNFFDPRLNDASKFPVAARAGFGNLRTDPARDQVTSKLASLHFYQLAIPSPKPAAGVDFDSAAAARGNLLFIGKARCQNCHVRPLWTEPGWNLHTPEQLGIDDFQANRSPDRLYKTMNLAGLFVRERGLFMKPENKGRYYHDGRFATLLDVVNSYNVRFNLGLTEPEKRDLVEYLKSLFSNGSAIQP